MWLLRSELPVVRLYPSSRQRIVLQREISRLKQSGTDPERLSLLENNTATRAIKLAQETDCAPCLAR